MSRVITRPRFLTRSLSRAPGSAIRWNSTLTRTCPACQNPVPLSSTPCPKCSRLLPLPSSLSHYSLLSLTQPVSASTSDSSPSAAGLSFDIPAEITTASIPCNGYDLDVRQLRNRMLQRQKELHPDKYQDKKDVALAQELSGRVNTAYEVLGDPLRRAEYLLSLHQLATEETESLTDPGLLAEILEAREELDEATTEEEVDQIRKANHEKVQSTIQFLKDAFSESPPNLAGAKILAVQLKYWIGLENAAKEWAPKQ